MRKKVIDLTNQRFGKLIVISRSEDYISPLGAKSPKWLCQCDCGKQTIVRESSLKTGQTKSCGCLKERKGNKKCGGLYNVWKGIRQRCLNKNSPAYMNYGGRGITICDEWLNDFRNFYNWAIKNGYKENLSIDRIDNDGDYCPENCKFSNEKQQARNRRTTKKIMYDGLYRSYAEIEEIKKLPKGFISHRLRRGFSIDEAINLPKFKHGFVRK